MTIANAGGFIFHAIVSRRLGVAAYGSLYSVISLVSLASFPSAIFNTVTSKIAAELRALDDPAHLRALTIVVCKVFGIATLAYVGAGALFSGPLGDFLHVPNWEIVAAAAMAGILLFVFALRGIAQGIQDFRGYSAAVVLEGAIKATAGSAIASSGLGMAGGLFGFIVSTVISGFITLALLWSKLRTAASTKFVLNVRRLYSTTAGATALAAAIALLSFGDVVVVRHFFPQHDAGIYAAISLGGKILFFLVSFAPTVVIPKAVDSHSRGQNPLIALRGAMVMVLALSALGIAAFFIGGNIVLGALVGGSFGEGAPLLPWYGVAMALLAVANVVASYSIALHRFAFSIPLVATACAEIAAIALYHRDLASVVLFLVIGNTLAVLVVAASLALRGGGGSREVEAS